MTNEQMQGLFRIILAGWASQRQRLTSDDVGEMAKIYAAGLMDLDFDVAKAAVIRIVHTSKFLPTVAEIREAVGIHAYGPRRSGGEAWGSVLKAIREEGQQKIPGVDFVFNDPITARVVRSFGWLDLCASDNAIADRARFIEAYETIAKTERIEAQAAPGGHNPQLEHGATPAREIPAAPTRPVLSADERIRVLQEVLDEARANSPDVARALPPPTLVSVPRPPCECVEEYEPITWDGRCPNCNGFKQNIAESAR